MTGTTPLDIDAIEALVARINHPDIDDEEAGGLAFHFLMYTAPALVARARQAEAERDEARAALTTARADALEEAARHLEGMVSGYSRESAQIRAGRDIIAVIRALATPTPEEKTDD